MPSSGANLYRLLFPFSSEPGMCRTLPVGKTITIPRAAPGDSSSARHRWTTTTSSSFVLEVSSSALLFGLELFYYSTSGLLGSIVAKRKTVLC